MKPINLGKVSTASDNATCQRNELEALEAIFAEDFSLQPVPLPPPALNVRAKGKAAVPVSASPPALVGSAGAFGVLSVEDDSAEDNYTSPPMLALSDPSASLLTSGPPFHITIYLRPFPANPEANHVAIHLHTIISPNYPDEVPTISVTNVIGMPKAQIDTLEEQLRALAQQLRGSEMVYQLTEAAMQYLFRHNVPLQQGSLHDQMIDFEKEQKKFEAIGNTTRKDKEKQRQRLKQKRLKAIYDQQLSESERPQLLQEEDEADSDWSEESSKEKKTKRQSLSEMVERRALAEEKKQVITEEEEAESEVSDSSQDDEEEDEEDEGEKEEEEETETGADDEDDADIFGRRSTRATPAVSREVTTEEEGDDSDVASTIQLPSPGPVELHEPPSRARLSSFREDAIDAKSQIFHSPSPFLTSIATSNAPLLPSSSTTSVLGVFASSRPSSILSSSSSSSSSSTSAPTTFSLISPSTPTISSTSNFPPLATTAAVVNTKAPSPAKLPTNQTKLPSPTKPQNPALPHQPSPSKSKLPPRKKAVSDSDEKEGNDSDDDVDDEGDESEEGVDLLHEFRHPLDMDFLLGHNGNNNNNTLLMKKKLEVSRRKKTDRITTPKSIPSSSTRTPTAAPTTTSTHKPHFSTTVTVTTTTPTSAAATANTIKTTTTVSPIKPSPTATAAAAASSSSTILNSLKTPQGDGGKSGKANGAHKANDLPTPSRTSFTTILPTPSRTTTTLLPTPTAKTVLPSPGSKISLLDHTGYSTSASSGSHESEEDETEVEGDDDEEEEEEDDVFAEEEDDYMQDFRSPLDMDFLRTTKILTPKPVTPAPSPSSATPREKTMITIEGKPLNWPQSVRQAASELLNKPQTPTKPKPPTPTKLKGGFLSGSTTSKLVRASEEEETEETDNMSEREESMNKSLLEEFSAPLDLDRLRRGNYHNNNKTTTTTSSTIPNKATEIVVIAPTPRKKLEPKKTIATAFTTATTTTTTIQVTKSKSEQEEDSNNKDDEEEEETSYNDDDNSINEEVHTYIGQPAVKDFALRPKPKKTPPLSKFSSSPPQQIHNHHHEKNVEHKHTDAAVAGSGIQKNKTEKIKEKIGSGSTTIAITTTTATTTTTTDNNNGNNNKFSKATRAKLAEMWRAQEDENMDMDESRYRYGMGKGARGAAAGSSSRSALVERNAASESRYQQDFDEIETLGKGGFGVVVKARNKIDGAYYAIKKMGVDEKDKEVLREVVALASLHHHHIVRYYQAWYEPMTPELLKQLPNGEDSGYSISSENTYTTGPGGPPNSVLYIQMEFCSGKTLKTFISETKQNVDPFTKPRRKKMIWTLFRQMLEALAFIHSKHMLHRDIKPENVFLDSTGSVKLGDFGLAVGETSAIVTASNNLLTSKNSSSNNSNSGVALPILQRQSSYISGIMNSHPEQTLEIGTMMYSAPEQMGARHGGYGPSADIYSLGIVFLEMWQPFGSASEKAACIAELRRTETVPDNCNYFYVKSSKGREARERARVKYIIESLIKHDPHARPTAEGLLASKLIPVLMDHPHFTTALRALEQPESELRLKILHQLFNLPVEDHVDYTFDHHSYMHKNTSVPENESLAVLRDVLGHIFRKHGAQWFTPPILVPRTQKVDISRKATVILLDSGGIPVEVCGHPTLSFARWAAKTCALNVRRFEIGRELEATTDVCTAPIEHLVGSFDVVWSPDSGSGGSSSSSSGFTSEERKHSRNSNGNHSNSYNEYDMIEEGISRHSNSTSKKMCESRCAFLQAEVIQVASELTGCLAPAIGHTLIYVNHTRLLETLVELCICVNNEESRNSSNKYSKRRGSVSKVDEEEETEDLHQKEQEETTATTATTATTTNTNNTTSATTTATTTTSLQQQLLLSKAEETDKNFIMRIIREQRNVSRTKLQDQFLNRMKHITDMNARKRYGDTVELLMTFLELKGPLNMTLEQLKEMTYVRTFLNSKKRYEGSSNLRIYLNELEHLCCALRSFGFELDTSPDPKQETSDRHVFLDMGFVPRYTVFQGIVLQVCQTPPSHPLIVGGCYDHLLDRFRPPDENHPPQSAMGISVHIPRLLECCRVRKVDGEALRRLINRNNMCTLQDESERVVLFADKGKMLAERAMLAGELWQRGVKAEMQSDFTLRQVVAYCVEHSIRFLVRFRVKTFAERKVVELQTSPFQSQCSSVLSINDVITHICQEGKTSAVAKPQSTTMNRLTNMNQDIEVKFVGGATKSLPVIAKIRKKLAPFVAMNPHRCVVVAINLSIIYIRGTSHAFLQDRVAETQKSPFFGPTPITPTRSRGKTGSQSGARPSSPKLVGRTGRRGSDSNIVIPERKSEMYFKNFVTQIPKERGQLVKAYHAFLFGIQTGTEFLFTYSLEEDKLDMLALT